MTDRRRTYDSPRTMSTSSLDNDLESRRCDSCKRTFKSKTGVKIHQTKMNCIPKLNLVHRTEKLSDEAEENYSPDENHSAENLNVRGTPEVCAPNDSPVKERIKWPTMNDNRAWKAFEDDAVETLNMVLKGSVEKKVEIFTTILHSMAKNAFGVTERKDKVVPTQKLNRRARRIADIRKELKQIKKRWLQAPEEEKEGLDAIRLDLRNELKTTRKAEYNRQKRLKKEKARSQFIKSPYQFVKKLLGSPKSGTVSSGIEEVQQFLEYNYKDPNKEEELPAYDKLFSPSEPENPFKVSDITLDEVKEVVMSARSKSAPGFSGISYKMYKKCPRLLKLLWKILRLVWKKETLPGIWQRAEGCFVPKEENSADIKQFRTVSLLSVECKIFFAILSKRMTKYMLENKYLDIRVQKGGVPGFAGCVEITSVLTQLIREARESKGELAVVWLDLTNAYGSIPHKLVELTLERYHIPVKVKDIIKLYYRRFFLRFTFNNATTAWQRLEKGIITGDTISVILFSSAMSLLVKTAEKECKGPVMKSGIRQPPAKAFMDDLTVATTHTIQTRWLLTGLECVVKWARMKFNAAKSRSLVLQKGKPTSRFRFKIDGEVIPSLNEKPIKCLGKTFDDTLKDVNNTKIIKQQLDKWLNDVDNSDLPGKYKAWCFQHGILPRVLWPLMIYDCPITSVEQMERRISSRLRKWLGVPPSFTNVGLYGNDVKLHLPISSLIEEFKIGKVRASLMIESSQDECVSRAGVSFPSGRKWEARSAIDLATSRLKHKDLIGAVSQNRAGLGSLDEFKRFEKADSKQKKYMIEQEIRAMEDEARSARAVSMRSQGAWTKWESAAKTNLSWNDLWRMEPLRIKFLLRSTYDLLATPTNMVKWGKAEDDKCPLCGRTCHLEHVLSSCRVALSQNRYTWRHNSVLKVIAHHLDPHRNTVNSNRIKAKEKTSINFVPAGKIVQKTSVSKSRASVSSLTASILSKASDWEMRVDIGKQLQIPTEITITNLRPDLILFSRKQKCLLILELTVPWETRIDENHERKRLKYDELRSQCIANGWDCLCFPIEVGCRGFVATSLVTTLTKLGIRGKTRKKVVREVGEAAEKASNWLWLKRTDSVWEHK